MSTSSDSETTTSAPGAPPEEAMEAGRGWRAWERDTSRQVRWLLPVAGVLGVVALLLGGAFLVDVWWFGQELALRPNDDGFVSVISTACESIPAVLGISLTVVVIIVELSATRYTPKVVDLFVVDRANLLLFALYVVTSVYVFCLTYVLRPAFLPPVAGGVALLLCVLCIALLLPYFHYVIKFARPENIICRLSARMEDRVGQVAREHAGLEAARREVIKDVEGLSDVSLGGIDNSDRWLVQASIWATQGFLVSYVEEKDRLPRAWHAVPTDHFLEFPEERRARITRQGTWVELTCFRQFEIIFGRALGVLPDVATTVALCLRRVCLDALRRDRAEVLELGVKFFNTFLRKSLNARDLRACYNVLYQYRLLAESVLEGRSDLATEIAEYLRYYGRIARDSDVPFILETVAHDLKDLNKVAHRRGASVHDELLAIFLEVDWTPETEDQEVTLRGVRKAQAMLAAFYLLHGEEELADRIRRDMEDEPLRRLRTIRDELLEVTDDEFWEITDRGVNFEYTDPEEKEELRRFFSWFEESDEDVEEPAEARKDGS